MSAGDRYRRVAPVYDMLIEPLQAGGRQVAFDLIPPRPEWQVLDVGCGTGTGMAPYVDAGCTVSGVDVSAAMLSRATARLGDRAAFHLTDGRTLPFDDNRFDLVSTTMVLHEVSASAREPFIAEMARVAKPDGTILHVNFRFGSLRGWRGPTLRTLSGMIERFSGHYSGYRSFKETGGVPGVIDPEGLRVEREKIVGGGNMAVWLVSPVRGQG